MNAPNSGNETVAIVGSGLTGLLAAQGLKLNGITAVVFEREESLDARSREWTILVHWAMPIFAKLVPKHILANLSEALCNPHLDFNDEVESLPCYNGITGDLLFSSSTLGARRVNRQQLRRLLAQGIDIRWNKSVRELLQTGSGVRLEFEDGGTFDANHILGADGSSSKVREMLLGVEQAQPRQSGFLFATGVTKFGDADKTNAVVQAHPVAALMMGASSVGAVGVMSVDDPNDTSTWTTFWVKIWHGDPVDLKGQEALNYIKENTAPLRGIFQSAIDWTPEGSYVSINEMKYWVPTPWNNYGGRVTLAGDAAHPMLIYRGQGFQHSITDVDNYVNALIQLRSSSSDAASREMIFGAYDIEMIERGATAVQQSLIEAENSLDLEKVKKMLMMRQGHSKSA
ncbi:hypothetical protein V496_02941 [Pseudogymnoascus sp. VKM F-4515 (FW-2607)]|nr:hypothetical protein V496_02941 [Pseudogymnoascus sp. VKM F-4515 (FW-2607)]KFY87161.1 hypothetical protein V498_07272 [Pseudogymnoascus sp. VKM F-4517 (FW-2822)]